MKTQIRILRNTTREWVRAHYNGKKYVIKPKGTITLEHFGQDEQCADYLLQTYGFLVEMTPQGIYSYSPKPLNTIEHALPMPLDRIG
jgi:hypothetical protein